MKKKQQAYQPDDDFESFGSGSSSGSDTGFDSFDNAPPSGKSSGFDFPAGAADSDMGGSFDEFPTPPQRSRASGGRSPLLPILALVLVLALAAGAFLLIPKKTEENVLGGSASPTGKTAFLCPGCERILNEVLVTADAGLSRKQIEEELAKLDGAIVGYLPVMNQYQIRFNTDTQKALDKKKAALEALDGVERADYNYMLTLSVNPGTVRDYPLPALGKNTLGLLGGLPPEGADNAFLLSSSSAGSVSAAELPGWLSGLRDRVAPAFRADQAAALLNQPEPQLFASCFFFEENKDGTVSGYTTTCALRWQVYCLAAAGAETAAFPFEGPRAGSADVPKEEIELNGRFFEALEKEHPSFILCKAWKENDFLVTALSSPEAKRHLVTVASCAEEALSVLDAAGAGRPVHLAAAKAGGADLAVCAANGEASVMLAAAQLASLRADRAEAGPDELKSALLASCGALAADSAGAVVPGFDPNRSGSGSAGAYRLLMLTARDSRNGADIPNVTFKAGSASQASASGKTAVLLPGGSFSVSAEAGGYKKATATEFPAKGNEAVVYLTPEQAPGTISGKITLSGSGIAEDLTVRFRNAATGAESSPLPLTKDYRLEANPGQYDLIISGYNRTSVTVHGVSVTEGAETAVPAFQLSIASDLPGTASGMIKDAMTGGALDGVNMTFFEGVNAPETDHPLLSAVSDSRGQYKADLPGGIYTVFLKKAGYRSETMLVTVEGEKAIGNQDHVITPTIPEGSVRIVLEWGPHPNDLDSHLVNQTQGIHVSYRNKTFSKGGRDIVTLDVDALGDMAADRSNRVETTTIHTQLPGKYTFYIHDFSDQQMTSSRYMADSGATVKVYIGDDILVFDVPNTDGTLWEVFTLENGILTPVNTVTYHEKDNTIGQ